jgi:hypothetical protein
MRQDQLSTWLNMVAGKGLYISCEMTQFSRHCQTQSDSCFVIAKQNKVVTII